jgi:hypothetical protein
MPLPRTNFEHTPSFAGLFWVVCYDCVRSASHFSRDCALSDPFIRCAVFARCSYPSRSANGARPSSACPARKANGRCPITKSHTGRIKLCQPLCGAMCCGELDCEAISTLFCIKRMSDCCYRVFDDYRTILPYHPRKQSRLVFHCATGILAVSRAPCGMVRQCPVADAAR